MKNSYSYKTEGTINHRQSFFRTGLVFAIFAALAMLPLLTGCTDDDDYYPTQTDPALYGTWQLSEVNGLPVNGYEVNYMEFDNDGDGEFTGYRNRMPYGRDFIYWCSGNSPYNTLNIVYDDGESVVMAYTVPDPYTLVTTWVQNGQTISYTYTRY